MAFLLSMKLAPEHVASNGMSGRPVDRDRATPHIELNLARQFDDGLGMMSVLEQRILDGLGSIDEQATVKPVLLQGDPLAASVSANEYDG
jgi:hypothetical protein